MPLQLFLNELSIPREKLARPVEVKLLKQLVSTVRAARRIDGALFLNSEVPLANFPLGQGTTIASVRNDGECVEESLYLKAINNRAPLKLIVNDANWVDPDVCEYKLCPSAAVGSGEVALGLGFAHLFNGLGVSLQSHDFWNARVVDLSLTKMDNDGTLISQEIEVRNANSEAAINHHSESLRETLITIVHDGKDLWQRRSELLPNLIFAPRTQAQLESLMHGEPVFEQVWIKLSGMDRAIEAWKISDGPHPMFPFKVNPESRNRQKLTEFRDANGVKRIFSDHCFFTPIEGRIHFIVETMPNRHAIIGHIGQKLGIG